MNLLFAYSLGTEINRSVPILDALKGIEHGFLHAGYDGPAESVKKVHDSIRQGDTMNGPMIQDTFFLPVVSYLAGIGENTGDLDVMMLKSADLLEKQVLYGFTDKQRDEIAFYTGFHTLLDAGIPELRSTLIMAELSADIGPKKEALEEMCNKIAKAGLKDCLDCLGDYVTPDVKAKFTYTSDLGRDFFRISKYLERKYTAH